MAESVTSEKIKNPGRQEWGRKLGKMSKELKLKKQQLEANSEAATTATPATTATTTISVEQRFKVEYLLGAAALGVALVALYYQKKSYESAIKDSAARKPTGTPPESKFTDF